MRRNTPIFGESDNADAVSSSLESLSRQTEEGALPESLRVLARRRTAAPDKLWDALDDLPTCESSSSSTVPRYWRSDREPRVLQENFDDVLKQKRFNGQPIFSMNGPGLQKRTPTISRGMPRSSSGTCLVDVVNDKLEGRSWEQAKNCIASSDVVVSHRFNHGMLASTSPSGRSLRGSSRSRSTESRSNPSRPGPNLDGVFHDIAVGAKVFAQAPDVLRSASPSACDSRVASVDPGVLETAVRASAAATARVSAETRAETNMLRQSVEEIKVLLSQESESRRKSLDNIHIELGDRIARLHQDHSAMNKEFQRSPRHGTADAGRLAELASHVESINVRLGTLEARSVCEAASSHPGGIHELECKVDSTVREVDVLASRLALASEAARVATSKSDAVEKQLRPLIERIDAAFDALDNAGRNSIPVAKSGVATPERAEAHDSDARVFPLPPEQQRSAFEVAESATRRADAVERQLRPLAERMDAGFETLQAAGRRADQVEAQLIPLAERLQALGNECGSNAAFMQSISHQLDKLQKEQASAHEAQKLQTACLPELARADLNLFSRRLSAIQEELVQKASCAEFEQFTRVHDAKIQETCTLLERRAVNMEAMKEIQQIGELRGLVDGLAASVGQLAWEFANKVDAPNFSEQSQSCQTSETSMQSCHARPSHPEAVLVFGRVGSQSRLSTTSEVVPDIPPSFGNDDAQEEAARCDLAAANISFGSSAETVTPDSGHSGSPMIPVFIGKSHCSVDNRLSKLEERLESRRQKQLQQHALPSQQPSHQPPVHQAQIHPKCSQQQRPPVPPLQTNCCQETHAQARPMEQKVQQVKVQVAVVEPGSPAPIQRNAPGSSVEQPQHHQQVVEQPPLEHTQVVQQPHFNNPKSLEQTLHCTRQEKEQPQYCPQHFAEPSESKHARSGGEFVAAHSGLPCSGSGGFGSSTPLTGAWPSVV